MFLAHLDQVTPSFSLCRWKKLENSMEEMGLSADEVGLLFSPILHALSIPHTFTIPPHTTSPSPTHHPTHHPTHPHSVKSIGNSMHIRRLSFSGYVARDLERKTLNVSRSLQRCFWRSSSGAEVGHWTRVRHEDTTQVRHVGEGAGMRERREGREEKREAVGRKGGRRRGGQWGGREGGEEGGQW